MVVIINHEEYLKEFKKITDKMFEITTLKNKDYSDGENAFRNFMQCESLGICSAEKGILVRMSDKMSRIANLLERDAFVTNEKIEDTLIDLSVYSIILSIYLKEKAKR
jgi:hypothetical protein